MFAIRACEREPVMSVFRRVLLSVCLLVLPGAAARAMSAEWKPMEFRDLREKSTTDILQTGIWAAEIREQNAYVQNELKRPLGDRNAWINALVASYPMGGDRLVVSILTSRKCDNGANHNASGIEASVCPLKIAVVSGNSVKVAVEASACFLDPPEREAPLANQHDAVQIQFDPDRRMVRMRALVGGQWVPQCFREFRVP